jgi:hypothetical protein
MFVTMWGVFDPFSGSADDFGAVLDRVKAHGSSARRCARQSICNLLPVSLPRLPHRFTHSHYFTHTVRSF